MFSFEDLEKIRQAMAQLGSDGSNEDQGKKGSHDQKQKKGKDQKESKDPDGPNDKWNCINLTPSQLLIIAGFLTGTLEVNSVLISKDQIIEIVLTGTLKKKTQLDKVMEQIGKMPFDRVVKAIIENCDSF